MKRSLIVLCALLLTLSVPAAYAASVVETGTGVQVIKSADWESKFPEIYASLTQNSENKEVVDYVEGTSKNVKFPLAYHTPPKNQGDFAKKCMNLS